jgi:hypothetical protein
MVDTYATHKHPKVTAWLRKHPHMHRHFTPTSASWVNTVEGFFRNRTTRRLRHDSAKSVEQRQRAITEYIAAHNIAPKPFSGTAKADDTLAKVSRASPLFIGYRINDEVDGNTVGVGAKAGQYRQNDRNLGIRGAMECDRYVVALRNRRRKRKFKAKYGGKSSRK